MNVLIKAAIVAFISGLLAQITLSQAPQTEVKWIGPGADWQPQDYFDSRGITAVRYENGKLVLTAKLLTRDVNNGKGEAFLDTKFLTDLDCQSPIDLRGREIAVEFEAPDAFAGSENDPSRLYLFVKDENFASFYSAATNVTHGGKFRVTLKFTPAALLESYSEAQFNPARIRLIGVKVELGAAQMSRFEGSLYINSVSVNPPLTASTPPDLPASASLPAMLPGDKIEAKEGVFYLNDRKWFVVGANWRLTEYGQNFGVTEWFPSGNGVSRHQNFTRINLEYARRAGIKLLRVGLLDDGRVAFDRDGRVVGYDETFRGDVRTLLNLAQQAGVRIEFTLCDFLIAGKAELFDRVWLRGRRGVITDPALRADFRARFLVPFLTEFGNHPALFGFDLINEPEWIIKKEEGGGWEDYNELHLKADEAVPREALHAFINECANDIHQLAPGKLATVGVSARFIALVNNLGSLNYLAPHHYHWMGDLNAYVPLFTGRPWMLEEFPTRFPANASPGNIREYLESALALRGSGALFWTLTPEIDSETCLCADRPARLAEVRGWADGHAAEIYPQIRSLASVSAASYQQAELTSEMIVAGFGSGLATSTISAVATPLPVELAGTRVSVKDNAGVERPAGLFFVSPNQINYLIPGGTIAGTARITVTGGDGAVSGGTVQISAVAPGLFTANASGQGLPAGYVLRVKAGGEQTLESVASPINLGSASDQVYLILFGTGIRNRSSLDAALVTIGGTPAGVSYAGVSPDYEGLDQINIGPLPRSLTGRGELDVTLIVDLKTANSVRVKFQ